MSDNDIIKAFDILDKFEFFGGQRAGRLLWFDKPADIQEKDINGFNRDIDFLKAFIDRQKAEIERLNHIRAELSKENEEQDQAIINALHRMKVVRTEAIKEFAEKISKIFERYSHMHNYAEKAKRCTIETDEGTSIELVSVWDVIELKKHEMVDYETMNELQDNIETISNERLLSELEKDFRLLVKEMTEDQE